MAALAPGDPKLVSMIVNHLKNQGLFDQFRRDCLADVDTKPAYQNLRQRVDNFVSNHLASHTWSPHLNKNQLRNSLRQMVLQSGMLEVGVDRIISQVVDPKINHIFRPQVEKAVHEFLATLDRKEEPAAVSFVPNSEKSEPTTPGLSSSGPSTSKANDALSILDTITSLNQEASAARSTVENSYSKNGEKSSKKTLGLELKCQQSFDLGMEKDRSTEEAEKHVLEAKADDEKLYTKIEGSVNLLTPVKDFEENDEKTENAEECVEDMNALKDNIDQMDKKDVVLRKDEHSGLSKEERRGQGKEWESAKSVTAILTIKQKAKENLKKEYSLEDSDFEGLSDITVSSVHTSDLSSFDVDDDEEEGEVPESDSNEEEQKQSSEEKDTKLETNEEQKEGRVKPGRHPYIHKPFLYSKYYSDSDDEETVVQRRQSIAKEKAERLLRRQWNREKVAEKLKHTEDEKERPAEETRRDEEYLQTLGKGVTSNSDVEMDSRQMQQPAALIPKVNKATLKEQKVLEKKVALRRKRKGDLRNLSQELALHEDRKRKREQPDEFDEMQIKTENKETVVASFASKDSKSTVPTDLSTNPVRRLSESIQSNDESRNELKMDHEPCRKQLRSNSFSQESVMKALEVTAVNDFEIEGNINSKDLPKQDDEVKHIKESDEEVVVCKSGLRTDNYQIDADQKLRDPSEEKAMSNCLYVIVAKSDNKTLVSSNSSDPSLIEQSQDAKSGENSKIKEEKCDEKGKEKIYDAESSLSKSRDNIQEDAKGHEKNKEKRNEAEGTRPKFKENSQEDQKASEKGKQKLNDSENLRPKFKENTHEDAKGRERSKEMKNEVEYNRTKPKETEQDDKAKEKRNECDRSRSRFKESLQETLKGHEKGKERKGDSGSSWSKSKEKMQEDIRSHEKVKEIQNESESSRSKSRENIQEDVRSKEKRKCFENSRSRSKEELQEDKRNEKRIEKRHDSEIARSKSKEIGESSRSQSKDHGDSSWSKFKDSGESPRSQSKDHGNSSRSKYKDSSESSRSKSKDGDESLRSKSKDRGESTRSKSKDRGESTRSKSKDGCESSRSKSKDNGENSRSKSKDSSAISRSKSKDGGESSRPKSMDAGESSQSQSKDDGENPRSKSKDGESSRSKPKDSGESSRSQSKDSSESSRSQSKDSTESSQSKSKDSGENLRSKSKGESSRSKSKDGSESSRSQFKDVSESSQSKSKDIGESSRSKSRDSVESSLSKSKDSSESSRSKSRVSTESSRSKSRDSSESSRSKSKDSDESSRSKSKDSDESSRSKSKENSERSRSKSKDSDESSRTKSKDGGESLRSKSKDSNESSRSEPKEDNECNQKGMEKGHDSGSIQMRHDSENTCSKSSDKVFEIVQNNEREMEEICDSENTVSKPKDHSESSQSIFKENMQDGVQNNEKGNEKSHDSKNIHFENSRLRCKGDLQEDKVDKEIEKMHDFENTLTISQEDFEPSRLKSTEQSKSSQSKYKENLPEDIQMTEDDRKCNSENVECFKSKEYSERSQSKSNEKGKENFQNSEIEEEKINDFESIRSKPKEYLGNVQEESKEKGQSSEKGAEKKDNFEDVQSRSTETVQNNQDNGKSNGKEIDSQNSLSQTISVDYRDVQTREESNLENAASNCGNVETARDSGMEKGNEPENDQPESEAHLQENIKTKETENEKKNDSESKLKEWPMEDIDKTNHREKESESFHSKSKEEVQVDQTNAEKGINMESSQLKSEESTLDSKEIAQDCTGNLNMETEKILKSEDKLEGRNETFESEGSECRHVNNIQQQTEHGVAQSKTGDCTVAVVDKEQTEEPAHDQAARPNELSIPLNVEQCESLLSTYEAISPDTPTLDDAGLQRPISSIAQFVHYDPSSPATPTLDENFSYEAHSGQDTVEPSGEGSGKDKAQVSENIKEDLCNEQQAEEPDAKCDPSKEGMQELPVQQDVVSEIITSASCEWKDEAAEKQSVDSSEEQTSSQRERKPKRPYTPAENPSKRRHLHSEEIIAEEEKDMPKPIAKAEPVQVEDEERPTQSQDTITTKPEEKTRSQTSGLSIQNKPTTRAAKRISSPQHLPVTERERRSSVSAKQKLTSDTKAGKPPATMSITRSKSQPPVTKQGRKREASPGERRRGQHKIEVPPKRTRR